MSETTDHSIFLVHFPAKQIRFQPYHFRNLSCFVRESKLCLSKNRKFLKRLPCLIRYWVQMVKPKCSNFYFVTFQLLSCLPFL